MTLWFVLLHSPILLLILLVVLQEKWLQGFISLQPFIFFSVGHTQDFTVLGFLTSCSFADVLFFFFFFTHLLSLIPTSILRFLRRGYPALAHDELIMTNLQVALCHILLLARAKARCKKETETQECM